MLLDIGSVQHQLIGEIVLFACLPINNDNVAITTAVQQVHLHIYTGVVQQHGIPFFYFQNRCAST
ncbi:hypothetical protein D3C73_1432580 [compost metagenome]